MKADVQGSVEVLSEMLPRLSNDQVRLKVIQASVGAVTERDVLLASASNAIIVAFNVRPERKASDLAQREGVDIRLHTIIYELIDELKKAVSGLLAPLIKETYLGRAEVRDTFRVKGVGMIAGCSVQDGIIKRDADVRVLRDNVVDLHGENQFAAAIQGRRQRSARRLRVRRGHFQFQRCESWRFSGMLQDREGRAGRSSARPGSAAASGGRSQARLKSRVDCASSLPRDERKCRSVSSHWKSTSLMRSR